jgi:hypothetical protein
MTDEKFELVDVVEIIRNDEKWLLGGVKGGNDVYAARYRECFVLDQESESVDGDGNDESNISVRRFHREWIRQEQNMFPLFKFSVDAQKEETLEQRYLTAFNSNRPRYSGSYGEDTWNILVNFMGPILDTSPVRDPYDYDSDEDEWSDYEMNKRRTDYGCQHGCCDSMSVINE